MALIIIMLMNISQAITTTQATLMHNVNDMELGFRTFDTKRLLDNGIMIDCGELLWNIIMTLMVVAASGVGSYTVRRKVSLKKKIIMEK